VSNGLGEVTSAAAQLLVVGAPGRDPAAANVSVAAGGNASFSVAASGDALRYQWLRDNVAIIGATGTSYTTPTVLSDNGARFSVLVYNGAGLLFSQAAPLTVTAPAAMRYHASSVAAGQRGPRPTNRSHQPHAVDTTAPWWPFVSMAPTGRGHHRVRPRLIVAHTPPRATR
jgi:hypothetical protein